MVLKTVATLLAHFYLYIFGDLVTASESVLTVKLEERKWVMWKRQRGSFLYRLIIQFIFIVVIPIFCCWLIFEEVLKVYYAKNTLAVQYNNMEHCIVLLEKTMETAQNSLESLKESEDIAYYLEYNSSKSLMPYAAFKRINSLGEGLCQTVPYLENVKIYCDSPLVLYAWPLVDLEEYPLEEDVLSALKQAEVNETVWKISFSEEEKFSAIYGYQKIYDERFLECIGYMEIQLSPSLLGDYLQMMSDMVEASGGVLSLYQDNISVYSTNPEKNVKRLDVGNLEPGYKLQYLKRGYTQTLFMEKLGLYVVGVGPMSGLYEPLNMMSPSLVLSVIIISLLFLFVIFFMSILSLSRRILHFADFVGKSDSDNLHPYEVWNGRERGEDELDSLIYTYNTLIRENSTLMSRIEKMELLTQAARFNALQHQMHPHFIYGTLETIRSMVLLEQNDEAVDMIYSLSVLLRHSLEMDEHPVTLKEELEVAAHYMGIQRIRYGDRITYIVQVEEALLDLKLPAFILQPILENAIFYSVSKTRYPCEMRVTAAQSESDIVLKISNTGLLITPERLQEVNGLLADEVNPKSFVGNRNGKALYNIKERLRIFYEGRAFIRLALEDERTVNIITIKKDK